MPLFRYFQVPNLSVGAANLKRVCCLRIILIFTEIVCSVFAFQFFHIVLPVDHLSLVTLLNLAVIGMTWWRLECIAHPVSQREFFIQLVIDVVCLSLFLYFTGGYTNPLVSLLLIPTSIGAALLPERLSWSLSLSAISAYSLLLVCYQPIASSMEHSLNDNGEKLISLHLVGMWITFVISALLINYFVIHMAFALRQQQAAIATARERQLRDENILAVAIQAAGAAHELGTPLATMAVVLGDIREEYADYPSLSDDLQLLQNQVHECKKRLKHLIEESQNTETELLSVKTFMERSLDQWQLLRPDIPLDVQFPQWSERMTVRCDLSLFQAFIALLDNAAEASQEAIDISLLTNKGQIIIRIDNQGKGIPAAIAEQIGTMIHTPHPSSKQHGLGLGLLLSQASIERLGGQVRLYHREPEGTRTEVYLPSGA